MLPFSQGPLTLGLAEAGRTGSLQLVRKNKGQPTSNEPFLYGGSTFYSDINNEFVRLPYSFSCCTLATDWWADANDRSIQPYCRRDQDTSARLVSDSSVPLAGCPRARYATDVSRRMRTYNS
ncbi:hypothetical protein ACJJTC_003452 [Scirpophaga incertulas]